MSINIFAPAASRIVRVLLINKEQEWSIYRLSKEANTGFGHTWRVVHALLAMGLCRKTRSNTIKTINSKELLYRWASYHNYPLANKVSSYYSEEKEVDKFLEKIKIRSNESNISYALTLHAGANLIAPFVRPVDVHFYIKPENKEEWVKNLDLELIEFGGNIHLVEPYDSGVFYGVQAVKGQSIVSNVQLYVDLYNYPARGREAAEHLLPLIL